MFEHLFREKPYAEIEKKLMTEIASADLEGTAKVQAEVQDNGYLLISIYYGDEDILDIDQHLRPVLHVSYMGPWDKPVLCPKTRAYLMVEKQIPLPTCVKKKSATTLTFGGDINFLRAMGVAAEKYAKAETVLTELLQRYIVTHSGVDHE